MAWDRTWDRIGWGQDPGEDKQKSKHLAPEEAKVARQALGLSLVVTNYWVSTSEPDGLYHRPSVSGRGLWPQDGHMQRLRSLLGS